MWNLMDIILFIRLYSSRLKVCRALNPTACSKMLSKEHVRGGRKILDSLLLADIHFTLERFNTGVCQAIRMLSIC